MSCTVYYCHELDATFNRAFSPDMADSRVRADHEPKVNFRNPSSHRFLMDAFVFIFMVSFSQMARVESSIFGSQWLCHPYLHISRESRNIKNCPLFWNQQHCSRNSTFKSPSVSWTTYCLPKYLEWPLVCTKSHQYPAWIGWDIVLHSLLRRLCTSS